MAAKIKAEYGEFPGRIPIPKSAVDPKTLFILLVDLEMIHLEVLH